MKILGIDTATDICGIALTNNKQLIAEYRLNLKRVHAEKLIGIIDNILRAVNTTVHDLDAIAISIGPGSFTGLRIGLSAVKGLTFGTHIPVVAINTLDALAYNAIYTNGYVCPIIKAQTDQCYSALYHVKNFTLTKISEYQIITLEQLNQFIRNQTIIINIGMQNVDKFLNKEKYSIIAPESVGLMSGFHVAQLGYEEISKNNFNDINSLEPYYLKDFIAKKGKKLV